MTKRAKRTGRPSTFSQAVADEIVRRIASGEPLAVICRDDGMPCDNTVRAWAKQNEPLSEAIAHAREVGHDMIAWRARMTLRGFGPDRGGESTGDVQRDRAIADYDLKLLAKWDPKRYGDKVALTGGGPDDPPIEAAVTVRFV